MEYASNKGKKVDIEVNNKIFKRHVIKIEPTSLNTNLYALIKQYVLPLYKQGDVLYLSQKFASICTTSFLYKYDIKISKLAQKAALKIHLLEHKDFLENTYAMQVAIYMVGFPNIAWANLAYSNSRQKFIEAAGKKISLISGLDGTYFPEYENIAIIPPVDASDICHNIRKNFGITCFMASANEYDSTIVATSRDMKMTNNTLNQLIADNPLGEDFCCTPFCIIRDETFNPPQKKDIKEY